MMKTCKKSLHFWKKNFIRYVRKHHLTRAYREKKQKKCYQPYTKHRLTGQ